MSAGHAIADMAHSIEMTAAHKAHAADMQYAAAVVERERLSLAENLAELVAVRAALAKFDPDHPLLRDEDLRQRARQAGRLKYLEPGKKSWEEVAHASDAVQYSYMPAAKGSEAHALKTKLAEVESANIQNLVEKHALRTALKRVDESHPLVRPDPDQNMLVAALRKAGLMAYSFGGYDAVSEAGRTFKYPEDMLWGQRESVLEAYPGEIDALEKRLKFLRNPNAQRSYLALKEQSKMSPS